MGKYAVEIKDVSKMFKLYHENVRSLKEKVLFFNKRGYEEFWALKDINIDVDQGETLGIIGANGSGKSTLLKMTTRILYPTRGRVVTNGSIAALLELGAGFQPDLTGRENVYLNASILGFSKREVDKRFDEIVALRRWSASSTTTCATTPAGCTCGWGSPWRSALTPTS